MITDLPTLQRVFKNATAQQLADLDNVCKKYSITPGRRFQYFMAQMYAETAGFTKFVEDLYYTTPSRLVAVWPSRFYAGTPVQGKLNAADYLRDPPKLANTVYANRMGNGDFHSNDGYNYRGRGGGHLTGKDNYTRCSIALLGNDTLIQYPEKVADVYVFGSFGWFWDDKKLNPLADRDEYTNVTARINGASGNRLAEVVKERLPYLRLMKQIFPA